MCPIQAVVTQTRLLALFMLFALAAAAGLAPAADKVLYEKPSAFNSNIIVTEDAAGLRVLRFEHHGARQSIAKPGDPTYLGFAYTKVAFAGLALTPEPRRILIVGLGGGTMAMFLRHYYPQAWIDVVDIDPDVVQVAKEFFGFREDEKLRAHVDDGRKFIESVREPYDVIFLDAFGARNVPPHLTTVEFMRAVKRAVRPTGVVVGNIWGAPVNPLFDSMVRTYQEVFDELIILDVPATTNKILLSLPRKHALTRAELIALARKTGADKQFQFDLAAITEDQFNYSSRKGKLGQVLRDTEAARR